MKKFGTPIFAAPGSASEYDGSFCAGVDLSASVSASVSASAPRAPPWRLLDLARQRLGVRAAAGRLVGRLLGGLLDLVLGLVDLLLSLSLVLPVPPFWLSGVAVAVGGRWPSASAVTVGAAWPSGVGVVSVEPRSTIEETAAGRPGIWIWSTGVPGGISTVIVSCWPVTSVTRT